jgi:hypothetical protein
MSPQLSIPNEDYMETIIIGVSDSMMSAVRVSQCVILIHYLNYYSWINAEFGVTWFFLYLRLCST